MHAYRYSDHEQQVAALARELGFPQVSASHEVSPLIKLVGRGDTTVVDAICRRSCAATWRRSAERLLTFPEAGGDEPR